MRSLLALALTAAGAFVAGGLAVVAALVASGAALLSSGGLAFGGAFDPVTATLAVGLGGLALRRLRAPAAEVPA